MNETIARHHRHRKGSGPDHHNGLRLETGQLSTDRLTVDIRATYTPVPANTGLHLDCALGKLRRRNATRRNPYWVTGAKEPSIIESVIDVQPKLHTWGVLSVLEPIRDFAPSNTESIPVPVPGIWRGTHQLQGCPLKR